MSKKSEIIELVLKESVKMWMGSEPTKCDLCGEPLEKKFIDGKTTSGPWGMLCEDCHETHGVGLGLGRGQMYEKRGKNWVKIAG